MKYQIIRLGAAREQNNGLFVVKTSSNYKAIKVYKLNEISRNYLKSKCIVPYKMQQNTAKIVNQSCQPERNNKK